MQQAGPRMSRLQTEANVGRIIQNPHRGSLSTLEIWRIGFQPRLPGNLPVLAALDPKSDADQTGSKCQCPSMQA